MKASCKICFSPCRVVGGMLLGTSLLTGLSFTGVPGLGTIRSVAESGYGMVKSGISNTYSKDRWGHSKAVTVKPSTQTGGKSSKNVPGSKSNAPPRPPPPIFRKPPRNLPLRPAPPPPPKTNARKKSTKNTKKIKEIELLYKEKGWTKRTLQFFLQPPISQCDEQPVLGLLII